MFEARKGGVMLHCKYRLKTFLLLCAVVILVGITGNHASAAEKPAPEGAAQADVRQLLIVQSDSKNKQVGTLTAWQKKDEKWLVKYKDIPVNLGRSGVVSAAQKQEGDGATPAGLYKLRRAFGYESFSISMPYIQVTKQHYWIDDVASPFYNQLVVGKTAAKSYELMRRKDELYKLGLVIEYNTEPVVAGKGSAIFMHVRKGPGVPTSGCVAMAEKDIKKILKWLKPEQNPAVCIE